MGAVRRRLALLILIVGGMGGEPPGGDEAEPLACGSIDHVFRLTPRLYSGARPEHVEDFRALGRLGVRLVVSVDGIAPDVEAARSAGLRYVHVPLDYGSIGADEAARLVRAVETAGGPVFVHCHHGRYRGPAAAAVVARAIEGWTAGQAVAWLATAGLTPEEYPDLHASVAAFRPPSRAALDAIDPAALPERAEVPDLVERMVEIDRLWDTMKGIQPDAAGDPAAARQLAEQFRESARLDASRSRGDALVEALDAAGREALALEAAWREERADAAAHLDALRASCVNCHRTYRNRDAVGP